MAAQNQKARGKQLLAVGLLASAAVAAAVFALGGSEEVVMEKEEPWNNGIPQQDRITVGSRKFVRFGANWQGLRNFDEARQLCLGEGMELASLQSQAEATALGIAGKWFWFGLRKPSGTVNNQDAWFYVDGSKYRGNGPFEWAGNEGLHAQGSDCAIIWTDRRFHNHPCNQYGGVICEEAPKRLRVQVNGRVFERFDSSVTGVNLNFEQSDEFCQLRGMTLASITTQEELQALSYPGRWYWQGLHKDSPSAGDAWRFLDGTSYPGASAYKLWAGSEATNTGGACSIIWTDRRIHNHPCSHAGGFVCEEQLIKHRRVTAGNKVYERFDASVLSLNFDQARDHCLKNGMMLASVTSAADMKRLAVPGKWFWIGLRKPAGDRRDLWWFLDGTKYPGAAKYGLWAGAEATNNGDGGAIIWVDGKIHNHPLGAKGGFICEKRAN